MAGRPKNKQESSKVEMTLSPKLLKYLDLLKEKEGFGNSRPDIIRGFVWDRVNELIKDGRLKEIE